MFNDQGSTGFGIRQRYDRLQQEYGERLAPLQQEREALWSAIERDLQGRMEES